MSNINVSSAQPRRLIYVQQQWTLEILRWQALDRDLFQPILSYVSGPENILRYLGEFDSTGHLLTQAERLLVQPGSPETVYEAQEGHWIAQTNLAEWPSPPPTPQASTASDLSIVLAHLSSLEERLARLETRLQGRVADNDGQTPSVRPLSRPPIPNPHDPRDTHDEAKPIGQTG